MKCALLYQATQFGKRKTNDTYEKVMSFLFKCHCPKKYIFQSILMKIALIPKAMTFKYKAARNKSHPR